MGPPAEQLIRDYLNRLSVAARDRLGPDERRALVERTRKLIERKADFAGRPTTLEVGRVLARLGDPAVLVEQEWRRLAVIRGELPAGTTQAAETPQEAETEGTWELAVPTEPGSSRGFLAWALRREPGRAWRAHSGSPTAVASENGTSHGSVTKPGSTPVKPQWPSVVARDGGTAPYPQSDPTLRNGTTAGAELMSADPGRADADRTGTQALNGTNGSHGTAEFETAASDEHQAPGRAGLGSAAVRQLAGLASAAWEHPLEATAIILLGLGGVIFPPVFVLGAAVALGSRLWHYRDKWVGLVLPPLLTVIALAAAIAIGGRSHGLHDAWVSLNLVSRVAALLGAGYLAWRVGPGRRPPPSPPWHKPHRAT